MKTPCFVVQAKRVKRDHWTGQDAETAEANAEAAADLKLRDSALDGDLKDLLKGALEGTSSSRVYIYYQGDMEHGRVMSKLTGEKKLQQLKDEKKLTGEVGPSVNVLIRTLTDANEVPFTEKKLERLFDQEKLLFLPERPVQKTKRGKSLLLRPWGRDEDLSDSDDDTTRLYWVPLRHRKRMQRVREDTSASFRT